RCLPPPPARRPRGSRGWPCGHDARAARPASPRAASPAWRCCRVHPRTWRAWSCKLDRKQENSISIPVMNVRQLLDLGGKVALVTGGSRGLGLQIAEALGEMGAKLAITARKQNELDEAAAHLKKLKIEATAYVCDMGKREAIPPCADEVLKKFG